MKVDFKKRENEETNDEEKVDDFRIAARFKPRIIHEFEMTNALRMFTLSQQGAFVEKIKYYSGASLTFKEDESS